MKKAVQHGMRADIPDFQVGDTVNVSVRITEGDKERIQVFTGTVIGRKGAAGMSATFTVRRIVNNEGVERVFPLHSPKIAGIEVVRGGRTRRAKLYFLRDRVGKSTRLRDTAKKADARAEAPADQPAAQPAAAEGDAGKAEE